MLGEANLADRLFSDHLRKCVMNLLPESRFQIIDRIGIVMYIA
jgi:hypothetical protein